MTTKCIKFLNNINKCVNITIKEEIFIFILYYQQLDIDISRNRLNTSMHVSE